jgi:hypothetical protein
MGTDVKGSISRRFSPAESGAPLRWHRHRGGRCSARRYGHGHRGGLRRRLEKYTFVAREQPGPRAKHGGTDGPLVFCRNRDDEVAAR